MGTTASGFWYPDPGYTSGWRQAIQDHADSAEDVVSLRAQYTYRWADSAERAAESGMRANDRGYQIDAGVTYRYSGTTWQPWDSDVLVHSSPFGSGVTVGNGTVNASYRHSGYMVECWGGFVLGSTSAVTGAIRLNAPVTLNSRYLSVFTVLSGDVTVNDTGTATYAGSPVVQSSTTLIDLMVDGAGGTYRTPTNMSSSVPMTFVTNDRIAWHFSAQVA